MNNWNIIRWWVYSLYVSMYCIDLKLAFIFRNLWWNVLYVTFSLSLPFFTPPETDRYAAVHVFTSRGACYRSWVFSRGPGLCSLCPDIHSHSKSAAGMSSRRQPPLAQIKRGLCHAAAALLHRLSIEKVYSTVRSRGGLLVIVTC